MTGVQTCALPICFPVTIKAASVDKDEQKKRLIKKEEMKEALHRSPDYLDMLLMNMIFHIKQPMIVWAE